MDRATTLHDRSLVRLSGEDARPFLQGLVTQDVSSALPAWTGLLSAQGKCLFDFLVWADGDDLLLDVAAGEAEGLAKRLAIYRLRRAIAIAPEPGLAVHWAKEAGEGVPDPRLAALGKRWLGPAREGDASDAWRAHRLSLGVCEGQGEVGDLLWLECNAAELNGVSFTKGCFVGQENTARMNWRGKVNRRLFVVRGVGGAREKVAYPDLGLSVVHARLDAVPGDAIIPGWLDLSTP